MKKEVKDTIVAQLSDSIKNYQSFYLVDVSGMNAKTTSEVRRKCFDKGIKMVVVKNTLLRLAFQKINEEGFKPFDDVLKGSTAVMFTAVANAPAKLLKDYVKDETMRFKAAYAGESLYIGEDKLDELVALKSKEEVIAEIVALLQSPVNNVVSALQSGQNTITGVLKTLGDRPENN